jgi:origin recognition complex subunit 4
VQTATPEAVERGYYIVRLNGLLHSDDNIALKEISRQIQASGDEDGGAPDKMERRRVSTAESVQELMQALKAGSRAQTRCLVIVLDEFDLFVRTASLPPAPCTTPHLSLSPNHSTL